MCAIFDHQQVVLTGNNEQRLHIGEPHREMNGHESPSARGDGCSHGIRIQAIGIRIDIGEHGNTTGLQHGNSRSVPRVRGHDNFVAKLQPERLERSEQSDSAISQAKAVLGPVEIGKPGCEFCSMLARHWKAAPMTALDDLNYPGQISA